jgi:transglutaminase-like putative cysteine protease
MNLVLAYNRCACVLTLLAISSYVAATFYNFEPALLIGIGGLPAVAAAWWYTSRHRSVLPRWVVNGLLLLAVAYAAARAASQRVTVEVIAELVVLIQLIKLGDRRSPRDDAQVLALAVFLAIAAMLTSNQFWVGVQLVAFVPLLIATAMLFQLYSAWFATPRPSADPPARVSDRRAFRRIVAGATAATLALALFVFVIVPRGVGENVLGHWSIQNGRAQTAFTDHVKLGSATIISTSPTIVMDVLIRDATSTEDEPGNNLGSPTEVFYLRGAVLDQFDPKTGVWQPSAHPVYSANPRETADGMVIFPGEQMVHPSVRQDFTIYSMGAGEEQLFALWHPVRLQTERNASRVETTERTVTVRRAGPAGTFSYSMWSGLADPAPAAVERTPVSYDAPKLRALAAEILQKASIEPDPDKRTVDDDALAARSIQDYLQRNFTYSLSEQAPPAGADPIENFLFATKEGHCEYFAAAMTLLCRSIGVNARMIAGYVAAEFNASTGRYVIRESNAHAWVEAESAGRWRTFDPTPPSDLVRLHRPAEGLLASLRRAMESVEYAWNSNVVGFDEGARQRIFGPREGRRTGVFALADHFAQRLQNASLRLVLRALAAGITVFVAVAAFGVLTSWLAKRVVPLLSGRRAEIPAQARLPAQRRAQVRFYARLLEIWRSRGIPKPAWRPPRLHATVAGGPDASASERLATTYYAATFGDRTLSEIDLKQAEDDLASLERRQN